MNLTKLPKVPKATVIIPTATPALCSTPARCGRPPFIRSRVPFTMSMHGSQFESITKLSEMMGRSRSAIMRDLIDTYANTFVRDDLNKKINDMKKLLADVK
jgi:hypothetical protein